MYVDEKEPHVYRNNDNKNYLIWIYVSLASLFLFQMRIDVSILVFYSENGGFAPDLYSNLFSSLALNEPFTIWYCNFISRIPSDTLKI